LGLEEGRNLPFTWTADSKSLVFISDREGPFHLFKQSIDQPAPDLLSDANMVMGARLNPDGSEILYMLTPEANDPAGRVRLMRMPVSGGTPQIVLQEAEMENMQCARLPSKLCLFSRNEAHAIRFFRFDAVTGEEHELTQFSRSSELKFNWTLSSDGSMLALAPWRQGQVPGEIQIFSIESGKQRTLNLKGWTRIGSIDWAADNRSIWTSATDPSGVQALLKVDLHGKATPMLQDAQQEMGWAIPSPDGKRVAIWQSSGSANVWSLQGF
jgi:Tol biopolymer transport system component